MIVSGRCLLKLYSVSTLLEPMHHIMLLLLARSNKPFPNHSKAHLARGDTRDESECEEKGKRWMEKVPKRLVNRHLN